MRKRILLCLMLACLGVTASAQTATSVLLDDDFSKLPPRMFSSGVVGAQAEYHFLPAVAQKGNWQVSCFRSDTSQRAWRVIADGDGQAMYQSMTSKISDAKYMHPMLVAGDPLWGDYTLNVAFSPEFNAMESGVIFRYQNDRCYYFLGVEDQQAVLKIVNHASSFRTADITELGRRSFNWHVGETLTAKVTLDGDRIMASLNGNALFDVRDATWSFGRVALTADVPTVYHHVRVTAKPAAARATRLAIQARDLEEKQLQAGNPKLTLWKKIETHGFGTSRNLRFGDLNNDGQLDVLVAQVLRHGPKDRNCEVGCMTAMTFDGRQLWQSGEADPWNDLLTNDVAVQIHDIDNNGTTEVVYARDFKLTVADGATGRVLREISTPINRATKTPFDKFPRILGDSLFFADFRGQGHAGDIVLKDRYQQVFVLTDRLEPLWQTTCNTGHYPFAYDIDHDGKDELAIGYNLYDDDGTLLWSLEDVLSDHADGVAIANLSQTPGGPLGMINAASDEGMIFLDIHGKILKRHWIGHVQNPAIANFRDDLQGLETVSINFWGNQGIVSYFDSKGEMYLQHEPIQYGSMMLPVNWAGNGESLILLSADVVEGGMLDGWGRRVVRFPADGHP
ncbi:MAG: VCBS repeat-containing protein, partial [Phycisphaeraceae bacterium]|nr:VCBS repeat-containing protein [Phycisphaeraceae bacterium]